MILVEHKVFKPFRQWSGGGDSDLITPRQQLQDYLNSLKRSTKIIAVQQVGHLYNKAQDVIEGEIAGTEYFVVLETR